MLSRMQSLGKAAKGRRPRRRSTVEGSPARIITVVGRPTPALMAGKSHRPLRYILVQLIPFLDIAMFPLTST
jgi:hypothetical protein